MAAPKIMSAFMIELIKNECLYRLVNYPVEELQEVIDILQDMGIDVNMYLDQYYGIELPDEDPF